MEWTPMRLQIRNFAYCNSYHDFLHKNTHWMCNCATIADYFICVCIAYFEIMLLSETGN